MVSSVSTNANSLSQLMLWYQQQQAQVNAANTNQTDATSSSSVQGVSAAGSNSLVSTSQSLDPNALLVLLQTQQVGSSSSATGTSPQSGSQGNGFGQDFENLVTAIQSGSLTDAQQAFSTLSSLLPTNSSNDPGAPASGGSGQSPFLQALNQIGSDLQSGDLQGAQQTLASLQSTEGKHHHHHHGGGGSGEGSGNDLSSLIEGSGAAPSGSTSSSAQTETVTNADGSVTTITTNANGSVSTTTTAPTQTAHAGSTPTNALEDLLAALGQANSA